MKKLDVPHLIGYALSLATAILGVSILTGFFEFNNVPSSVRNTFGIVLILMAIYRFTVTRLRPPSIDPDQEDRLEKYRRYRKDE